MLVQPRISPRCANSVPEVQMTQINIEGAGPEYRFLDPVKAFLVNVGSRCGRKTLHFLSSSVNYLAVGHWMKAHGFLLAKRVYHRRELFDQMADRVQNKNVLYLEFGVAKGASMRYWSSLLANPASVLHGFDTFEGLPEDWRLGDKGAYSAQGRIPEIADPRVQFIKGLFQETLPRYVVPTHDVLVVNIDCDLYSSTHFVLNSLSDHIRPGTFLYFDEFSDPHNELRAFQELLTATGKKFALIGATRSYGQVSFECVG
jgi:Macrocin-O-methyltransferase (TylF)